MGFTSKPVRVIEIPEPASEPLLAPESEPQRTALLLQEVTREYAIPLLELRDLVAYASEFGGSYKPEPIPPSRHGLGRVRDAFSWRQMRRRLGKAFGG